MGAARQANVGQSTLRRWLREDDNFQNELRQYRQEALSHAALMLQQCAAEAVCIMYELIQSGRPVDRGRVSLIRTAIEYAFRAAVYLDIIDRVKALAQRRRLGDPTPPTPPATAPRSRLGAPNQEIATYSKETTSYSKQGTSQDPRKPKAVFLKSAHSCSRPAVEPGGNFRESAPNCSIRTPAFDPPKGAVPWSRARKQAVSPKPAPNRPSLRCRAPSLPLADARGSGAGRRTSLAPKISMTMW